MKRRSASRNYVEYLLARLILASLRWAPLGAARWLARLYATILDRAVPRLRRIAYRNLELALPQLTADGRKQIVDGVFASIGRLLLALARFPELNRDNIGQWIRYEGFEHFEEGLRRGKGVLFATAHLGNWELSAFAHGLMAAPMHVVVRPLDNPRLDALIERLRTLGGNRIIAKKDFARGILRALARNEAVGILIDQNTSREEGVFVDFFGVPACASLGFAKIASRSQATVIPGFALWLESEGRYVLRFYPPVEMTGDAAADTQRLQKIVEDVIRQYPDQWLWIHRRWRTRPPGEASLYDETG